MLDCKSLVVFWTVLAAVASGHLASAGQVKSSLGQQCAEHLRAQSEQTGGYLDEVDKLMDEVDASLAGANTWLDLTADDLLDFEAPENECADYAQLVAELVESSAECKSIWASRELKADFLGTNRDEPTLGPMLAKAHVCQGVIELL